MRLRAVATTVALACTTGPLTAQTPDVALETLQGLIDWSGPVGSAPNSIISQTTGMLQEASDCILYFDMKMHDGAEGIDVRMAADASALDPNQIFIWDFGDVQRLNMFAHDGSDQWVMSTQLDATNAQFDQATEMVASGAAEGSCTDESCTLSIAGRPLELPLPNVTTEDEIVATTVALQTLITQCGGSADTADN